MDVYEPSYSETVIERRMELEKSVFVETSRTADVAYPLEFTFSDTVAVSASTEDAVGSLTSGVPIKGI